LGEACDPLRKDNKFSWVIFSLYPIVTFCGSESQHPLYCTIRSNGYNFSDFSPKQKLKGTSDGDDEGLDLDVGEDGDDDGSGSYYGGRLQHRLITQISIGICADL
jgi:hypothetical protein